MDCKIQWQCTSTCSCDFSLTVALDVWWCSRVLIPPLNCIYNPSSPSIHHVYYSGIQTIYSLCVDFG